jgi:DNA-binding transcriptional regulator LsrR (DeoR family)
MARIARRYYLEGRSKRAIAEEFGLSRFQVARSLRKARDSGLVRIIIDFPGDTNPNEEERL